MTKCIHCGHENPETEIICIHCGLLMTIKPDGDLPEATPPKDGVTRRLDNAAEASAVPRWGTARLGNERKLLLHVRGQDHPLVVNLTDQLILGRYNDETNETPEVNLEPYDARSLGVSRRHAAIVVEDDGLKVMDLGSQNATYINGQKLFAQQSRILRDGDELRLGNMVIRVNFA